MEIIDVFFIDVFSVITIIMIMIMIIIIWIDIYFINFLDNTGYVYTPSICEWDLAFRSFKLSYNNNCNDCV